MKSFDPIDILFISLIGFYLLVLIIFIIIFVKLSKKYDDNGNKISNKDDQLITEMNEYSSSFLTWLKGVIKKVKTFIYNKLPKKEEVKEVKETPIIIKEDAKEEVKEMKTIDDLLEVKKTTPKKAPVKKKTNSTNQTKKKTTSNKKTTSTKKKTNTTSTKKTPTKKKSTSTSKKSNTTKKKAPTKK